MAIVFQVDDDLANQLQRDLGDLGNAAREALFIEAYRRGKLSVGRLARTLGVGVLAAEQTRNVPTPSCARITRPPLRNADVGI